jgi:hypothetical protein
MGKAIFTTKAQRTQRGLSQRRKAAKEERKQRERGRTESQKNKKKRMENVWIITRLPARSLIPFFSVFLSSFAALRLCERLPLRVLCPRNRLRVDSTLIPA